MACALCRAASCQERTCTYTLPALSRACPLRARVTPTLHRQHAHLGMLSAPVLSCTLILDIFTFGEENRFFSESAVVPLLGSYQALSLDHTRTYKVLRSVRRLIFSENIAQTAHIISLQTANKM